MSHNFQSPLKIRDRPKAGEKKKNTIKNKIKKKPKQIPGVTQEYVHMYVKDTCIMLAYASTCLEINILINANI